MTGTPREALVIGAGIAGASVAYFLSRRGIRVTVADTGKHTASHVPSALINPVRGQSGRVEARAVEGMHKTWQLVNELERKGIEVIHEKRGILRPVPDEKTRLKFEKEAAALGEWQPAHQAHWHRVLYIPEGGWLSGKSLCEALLAGVRVIQAEAVWRGGLWQVADETFTARQSFFCGGSWGVSRLGEHATHRMGSVLRVTARPPQPLSFGGYVASAAVGGVLGGTFEEPAFCWKKPALPLKSLNWLLDKGVALFDVGEITGQWTGSRLSGLQVGEYWAANEWRGYRLTGLSSKGFLLAPLLAEELVTRWLESTDSSQRVE